MIEADTNSFSNPLEKATANGRPVITLITDFGTVDGYIGVMKGVMLQIAPQARLVDITHDLPPFNIKGAAFLNDWSFGYFPVGSVHLCVVDPGVGTSRRILVAEAEGHFFVAPDNGILTDIMDKYPSVSIFSATNQRYWLDKVSHTFHGRDIFSPLAAHLAKGVSPAEMGPPIQDPVRIEHKRPVIEQDTIECHVRYIDRFGNLVTNLDQPAYQQWMTSNGCKEADTIILFHDQRIEGISQAYGERKAGELLAVFDGYDRLEIALSGGNASVHTGLGYDASIRITRAEAV